MMESPPKYSLKLSALRKESIIDLSAGVEAKSVCNRRKKNAPKKVVIKRGRQLSTEDFRALEKVISSRSCNVTTLKLRDNLRGNNKLGEKFISSIGTNETVHHLSLEACHIDDKLLQLLSSALKKNRTIEHISLKDNCKITHGGMRWFSYVLKIKNSLHSVNLGGINLSWEAQLMTKPGTLTGALMSNTSIRQLFLPHCKLGDEGLEAMSKALSINSTIKEIGLAGNGLTDRGICFIENILKQNSSIEIIDFSDNQIELAGAHSIMFGLGMKSNVSLLKLNMSNNKISDSGCESFETVLAENSTLQSLDLSNNIITKEGLGVLIDSLFMNKTLTELKLNGNIIDQTIAATLYKVDVENGNCAIEIKENFVLTPRKKKGDPDSNEWDAEEARNDMNERLSRAKRKRKQHVVDDLAKQKDDLLLENQKLHKKVAYAQKRAKIAERKIKHEAAEAKRKSGDAVAAKNKAEKSLDDDVALSSRRVVGQRKSQYDKLKKNLVSINVAVKRSQIHGVGGIAVTNIPKNTKLFKFNGVAGAGIIDLPSHELRTLPDHVQNMVKDLFVPNADGSYPIPKAGMNCALGISYFLNSAHGTAYEPNVEFGCKRDESGMAEIITTKDIEVGEELLLDYPLP